MNPIVLENEFLSLTVLPELGAKLSSLQLLPSLEELLQQPLQPYAPRTQTMAFDAADASGFDECLPSVSACEQQTATGTASIPDHGDFWRIPFEATRTVNRVHLAATGFSLPLHFEKTLYLDGPTLRLHYRVRNEGDTPCPYAWSAHPLFTVDPGDRVVLPASINSVLVEGSGKDRLGKAGTRYNWPIAKLNGAGSAVDLSLCGRIEDETGDKLYADAPPEGWCALDRHRLNTRIEVRFDPAVNPYLGLWLCYGGWPLHLPARQYCVALEPCMAPVDSLATAAANGWARTLAPQAAEEWSISIHIQPIPN